MTVRLPFQILGAAAFAVGSAYAGETTTVLAEPPAPVEDPFADRLLGDMGGIRTSLAEYGLSLDLDGWYTLQGVADGGTGRGDDVGNLFNGRLGIKLDTDKAGLWPGGFFSFGLQGRGGDSVLRNAGATSPVNNASLFPLVPGRLGDDAWAITELTYTQFLSERLGVTGGLIDTTAGDANPIAGSLNSFSHFMNTGLLYSSVTGATVPTATLGGGLIFIPSPNVMGSFLVVGSNETAGTNPFDNYEGTTFVSEWAFKYQLADKPGGVTVGGTYSIDQERFRISEDPRVLLGDVLAGGTATTADDAWSVYSNAFQFVSGDETGGWGFFARLGFSDGDSSAIDWNAAGGIGGVGLLPGRDADRWGLGVYTQEFINSGILSGLGVDNEVGGELFYNAQLTPSTNLTLDVQVVDSALPAADTAVVVGMRLGVRF